MLQNRNFPVQRYVCISSRGPLPPLDLELYSRASQFLVDPGGGGQGLGGGCGVVEVGRTLGGLLSAGQTEFCIVFAALSVSVALSSLLL